MILKMKKTFPFVPPFPLFLDISRSNSLLVFYSDLRRIEREGLGGKVRDFVKMKLLGVSLNRDDFPSKRDFGIFDCSELTHYGTIGTEGNEKHIPKNILNPWRR